MPKSPIFTLQAWVKNVYSLRTPKGTNSDKLPTVAYQSILNTQAAVHNPLLIRLLVQVFTPQLSTPKNDHFNLLNHRLYP